MLFSLFQYIQKGENWSRGSCKDKRNCAILMNSNLLRQERYIMSQEKVDKYKKEKATGKSFRKEKREPSFWRNWLLVQLPLLWWDGLAILLMEYLQGKTLTKKKQWLPQRWTPQQLLTTYPSFQGMLKKQNKTRRAAICSIQNCCP